MSKKRMAKAGGLMRRAAAVASAVVENPVGALGVFERLALDKRLTVEKLGELIRLQSVILERNARSAFDAAYAAMLDDIPRIKKNGAILNREKQVQSRYSRYEDIRAIVDPILKRHGFHVYTHTEWPSDGIAEVVGSLVHREGHTRESRFRAAADASGGKNAIQGLGSAVQYGRRYTLKDLLSIVEEGVDDDGQTAGASRRREPEVVPAPKLSGVCSCSDLAWDPHCARHSARPMPVQDVNEPITQKQRQRFAMILKSSGRNIEDVRAWLKRAYGIESSAAITRATYDDICTVLSSSRALPMRQPGEEG
jgi:hypothetical protein